MKAYALWSEKKSCFMSLVCYNDDIFLSNVDLSTNDMSNIFITSEILAIEDLPRYKADEFGNLEYREVSL